MKMNVEDVREAVAQCRQTLIGSEVARDKVQAVKRLTEYWDAGEDQKIFRELTETLAKDSMSELHVTAAVAIASLPSRNRVIPWLHADLAARRGDVTTFLATGEREPTQFRICYPLLILEDTKFFEQLNDGDLAPQFMRLEELIVAGRTKDIQAAASLIRYFEALEDDTQALDILNKDVRQLFPGFDRWLDAICQCGGHESRRRRGLWGMIAGVFGGSKK